VTGSNNALLDRLDRTDRSKREPAEALDQTAPEQSVAHRGGHVECAEFVRRDDTVMVTGET
jgi:hypothetical protein